MLKLWTERVDKPTVDVLLVTYNSRKWLDGFLAGLLGSDYPIDKIRLIVVDNASKDDGIAYLKERAGTLPFQVELIVNEHNLGFAGGYEVAFANASAEYWLVINQDTELVTNAISNLIAVATSDQKIGIAEARQAPREHPKYYDPFTRETSWCSGACMLVRREAVQQVGGFDAKFFMYAEDVDLSWRMWRHGWKCVYVPEAVVRHFTEELDFYRNLKRPHFFSMRNGIIMRVAYGSAGQVIRHVLRVAATALFSSNPLWHRWGSAMAIIAGLYCLPFALKKRWRLRHLPQHPMVFFNGWEYGRHHHDIAEVDPPETIPERLSDRVLISNAGFKAKVMEESRQRAWLDVEMAESVGLEPKLAFLTWNSEFSIEVTLPPNAVLHGTLGQSEQCGDNEGIFSVEIDAKPIFRTKVSRSRPDECDWIPFSVSLPPTTTQKPSRITMRHMGPNIDCWGYWSDLKITQRRSTPTAQPSRIDISIVVPTFNRAGEIGNVLQRLLSQDMSPDRYEILVVDNNSTDATQQALAKFSNHPQIQPLFCRTKGAGAARNVGLEKATGRLIIMMDDDILVRRDFLTRLWRHHIKDESRILLTKILHPFQGLVDPFIRYLLAANEVNSYDFADPNKVPPEFFYTGCVAVPKSIIGTLRFDERFQVYGVEDIDFGVELLRPGTRMTFLDDVEVWHDYYPRFDYFRKKKSHAGFSLGYYLSKRPWRRCHHVFEPRIVRHSSLIHWATQATRPLARLLEWYEAIRYRSGPVNRLLKKWYGLSIRVSMYRGMLEYYRTKGNASQLPDLGYRGAANSIPGRQQRGDDDVLAA
ncbi:MAG: hypothetical protein C0467_03060 [Planctomycetaceae bacterium]|nr:hypothetical protein [Planctomycetaceae bacterium]